MGQQTPLPGMDVDIQLIDQGHEAERALFEHMLADVEWGEDYLALMDEGWYWRDAAYIAWKSLPKSLRIPQTYGEFCDLIGISVRGMTDRRNRNKAIDLRAAKGVVARGLYDHIDEVMEALVESASNSNYKAHPDRKLFLEMAGVYVPKQAVDLTARADTGDMEEHSEEDLARLARLDELAEGDE